MLQDKRYGLTARLVATKVLPILTPQMVNEQLDSQHFKIIQDAVHEMLEVVNK